MVKSVAKPGAPVPPVISDKRLRLMLQHTSDIITVFGKDGTIYYQNSAINRVLGTDIGTRTGKNIFHSSLVHPEDQQSKLAFLEALIAARPGAERTGRFRMRHSNGEWRMLEVVGANLLHEPSVGAIVLSSRDISDRTRAETTLHHSEQKFAATFSEAPIGITHVAPSGAYLLANRYFCDLLGYTHEEVLRTRFQDLTHPEDLGRGLKALEELKQGTRTVFTDEKRYLAKDGSYVWVVLRVVAPEGLSPDQQYFVSTIEDITDRKRTEQIDGHFAAIVGSSHDAIISKNLDGYILSWNDGARHMFGYTAEEAVGRHITMLIPEELQSEEPGILSRIGRGERVDHFETIRRHKDGRTLNVSLTISPIRDSTGKIIGASKIARDITDQKQAAKALAESEAKWRLLAEAMPQKIFTSLPDKKIEYYNPQWTEYTGLTVEELQSWETWTDILHPDDVQEAQRKWALALETGEPFEDECRFRRHDGVYRWHITRALPSRDASGRIVMWIGSNTDIEDIKQTTQRKEELENLTTAMNAEHDKLVALNKSKDEFIALASHQLRTPATGVKQYLGLLLEGYAGPLQPEQSGFIEQAYASNERQITIVNDLLRVSQIDLDNVTLRKKKTDLVTFLAAIADEQSAELSKHAHKFVFAHPKTPLIASIDTDNLWMAIGNILDNAIKYTPEGKGITLKLSKHGKVAQICICDEGVGIEAEDLAKLFRKFSRIGNPLSIEAGGTGLGLYWAKSIVDLHGGSIKVDSKVDVGTTFMISLPL